MSSVALIHMVYWIQLERRVNIYDYEEGYVYWMGVGGLGVMTSLHLALSPNMGLIFQGRKSCYSYIGTLGVKESVAPPHLLGRTVQETLARITFNLAGCGTYHYQDF